MTRKLREKVVGGSSPSTKRSRRTSNITNIYDDRSRSPSRSPELREFVYPPYIHSYTAMTTKIDNAIMSKLKESPSQVETLIIDSTSYDKDAVKLSGMSEPFTLENFPKMKKLVLNLQKLAYEFDYSKMPQLEELQISYNKNPKFAITNRIHMLTHLRILNLAGSGLSSLPPYLAHMSHLKIVNIEKNVFTEFPEGLGNPDIEELNISGNMIVSFPVEILRKMKKLRVLEMNELAEYFIDQPDPLEPFCVLKSLEIWKMDGLKGIKKIPDNIGKLRNLKVLSLAGQGSREHITELPRTIGSLHNLVELHLTHSSLNTLPDTIANLKKLEILDLKGDYSLENRLESLPDEFCYLESLKELDIGFNRLRELPKNFGRLKNLQKISIYDNLLTQLPDSFCKLAKLEYVDFMENRLTRLPDCIGELRNLKSLNLQTNAITGLPDSLAQLHELEYLYITENQLETIPPGIANLQNIKTIMFDRNSLGEHAEQNMPIIIQLLGNPSLQHVSITLNRIRFSQQDVDAMELFNEAGRAAANTRYIMYADDRYQPNANTVPRVDGDDGAEDVANALAAIGVNPAANAMEIHREFDLIAKDELLEVLGGLKTFPVEYLGLEPTDENSFNRLLLSRLEKYLSYLPRKTQEDKAEYERIIGHLNEIRPKLQLVDFTGNITTLNIFYTVIEYVEKQPHEFQANYAYNYVLSNALAYCASMTDRTSCTLGMKERIVMDLPTGSAGLSPDAIKDEYVDIARIIQQDKIPAEWTNINMLLVKPAKIGSFASACINSKMHQKKMRLLHGLPNHREEYKALKTEKAREAFKLKLRKQYLEKCITRKIVGTFTDERDRVRFRNADAPLAVKSYVGMPAIEEMLEDDAFADLSHGGGGVRMRRKTRKHMAKKVQRSIQRK